MKDRQEITKSKLKLPVNNSRYINLEMQRQTNMFNLFVEFRFQLFVISVNFPNLFVFIRIPFWSLTTLNMLNPFTLPNARRFYSSKGDPLGAKGLI